MIVRISVELYGDVFFPESLKNTIKEPFINFSSNNPTDVKEQGKTELYGFGSISIVSPSQIGIQYELEEYSEWYVRFIENYYWTLTNCGVTDFRLFWEVFYVNQCNFEIFDKVQLKRLINYEVSIPISIHKVEKEEIIEMLEIAQLPQEKINELIGDL